MTQQEFVDMTKSDETVHLECKLARNAIPASFWEAYGSFANTDGWTIPLGVKEDEHIFSLVKIGERSGMGLSQLFGNWELAGYAKPILAETFNPERTRVSVPLVAESSGVVAEKVAEVGGQVTEKVTEKREDVTEKGIEGLNDTEERIVALIRSNAHITQKMLLEAIGLTRPHIGRKLLELQERKVIRRVGPDRGGIWELVK